MGTKTKSPIETKSPIGKKNEKRKRHIMPKELLDNSIFGDDDDDDDDTWALGTSIGVADSVTCENESESGNEHESENKSSDRSKGNDVISWWSRYNTSMEEAHGNSKS